MIRRQWVGLPSEEHVEIRQTLERFLTDHFKSAPPFIGNKLIKLLVDIARVDWPHFYPDFLSQALEMSSTPDAMRQGLTTLLIASEELATPRDDLSSRRKEELKKLLTAQSPQVKKKSYRVVEYIDLTQGKTKSDFCG